MKPFASLQTLFCVCVSYVTRERKPKSDEPSTYPASSERRERERENFQRQKMQRYQRNKVTLCREQRCAFFPHFTCSKKVFSLVPCTQPSLFDTSLDATSANTALTKVNGHWWLTASRIMSHRLSFLSQQITCTNTLRSCRTEESEV